MEIGNNLYNYSVDYYSKLNAQKQATNQDHEDDTRGLEKNETSNETKNNPQQKNENSTELTTDEKAELAKLQSIDSKVRAHEAAHQSGTAASGGASFTYVKGANGVMYAVGGEVPIRMQSGSTPQETMANAQGVIATALAPADPSAQDIAVASKARVILMKAQQEFAQEIQEKISNSSKYTKSAKKLYEENSTS
jgi:hypothetical protein